MKNTIDNIKEQFEQLQSKANGNGLGHLSQNAFSTFNKIGLPAVGHEEWKYTRISSLFNKEYLFPVDAAAHELTAIDLEGLRLPGHKEANELVFVNGLYSPSLSIIRSTNLVLLTLVEAAKSEYKPIVSAHLGHSANYLKDGINALNTAFAQAGLFLHVGKDTTVEHPVYIYNISDARSGNIFSQPRSLAHIDERRSSRPSSAWARARASRTRLWRS